MRIYTSSRASFQLYKTSNTHDESGHTRNVKDKTKLEKKFVSDLGPSISFKYLALTVGTASESHLVPGK